MALIKNAKSDRLLKEAVVLDMGDLARQADRILANARAESARILENARIEARKLIDQADARGFAQGHERGLEEGRAAGEAQGAEAAQQQWSKQLQTLTETWKASLAEWEADREMMLNQAKEDVIRFAFAVAQRVVQRIADSDHTVIGDQLAASLRLVGRTTIVEILIHPDDRQVAEAVLPELLVTLSRSEHVTLRDDQTISRGGCQVVTVGGRIDATVETQLDRIAEAIVPIKPHGTTDLQAPAVSPMSDTQSEP